MALRAREGDRDGPGAVSVVTHVHRRVGSGRGAAQHRALLRPREVVCAPALRAVPGVHVPYLTRVVDDDHVLYAPDQEGHWVAVELRQPKRARVEQAGPALGALGEPQYRPEAVLGPHVTGSAGRGRVDAERRDADDGGGSLIVVLPGHVVAGPLDHPEGSWHSEVEEQPAPGAGVHPVRPVGTLLGRGPVGDRRVN